MKRIWQILTILSVVFALVMNYIVATQVIDVPPINEISDKYATLLTPATYAFSIWSVIYLLLVAFAIYQARDLFRSNPANTIPEKIGPYFSLANIGNGIWTYVFVSGYIGLSVLILLGMVVVLFIALARLKIAVYEAPAAVIAAVWWPLMLYTGWVLVASVVNIASWLASIGINLPEFAAFAILVVLCNLLLVLLYTRNVRELVLASTWGIAAIAVQLLQSDKSLLVTTTAVTVSGVLLVAMAIHGLKNRHSNILAYMLQ